MKQEISKLLSYALSAYLDGFETAEAVLDVLDHDKRIFIEKKMMAYRSAIENKLPFSEVKALHDELRVILKVFKEYCLQQNFQSSDFLKAH